ncbi:hypothetical protein ACHAXS_006628 [Conticribra weissflogii]
MSSVWVKLVKILPQSFAPVPYLSTEVRDARLYYIGTGLRSDSFSLKARQLKPSVFSSPLLSIHDLPSDFLELGKGDLLLELSAPPRTWKAVLEGRPPKETLGQWGRELADLKPPPKLSNLHDPPEGLLEYDIQVTSQSPLRRNVNDEGLSQASSSSRSVRSQEVFDIDSLWERLSGLQKKIVEIREDMTAQETLLASVLTALRRDVDGNSDWLKAMEEVLSEFEDQVRSFKTAEREEPSFPPRTRFRDGTSTRSPSTLTLEDVHAFLTRNGYVRREELPSSNNAAATTGALTMDELSRRVAVLEFDLHEESGSFASIESRLQVVEDRRLSEAVEIGNTVFKNVQACNAWVVTLQDQEIYRFCVDFLSLLMLTQDAFETISEGMHARADAYKAQFNSLMAARISTSYELTFPEHIVKRIDKVENYEHGGFSWAPLFSLHAAYEEITGGTATRILGKLDSLLTMIQRGINHQFPVDSRPKENAVFSEQLRKSHAHAMGWLHSLDPLFKKLKKGGMLDSVAWKQVLTYTISIMEEAAKERCYSSEMTTGAKLWGSFRVGVLMEDFQRHKFIQHPVVSSVLALSAMEKEGDGTKGLTTKI